MTFGFGRRVVWLVVGWVVRRPPEEDAAYQRVPLTWRPGRDAGASTYAFLAAGWPTRQHPPQSQKARQPRLRLRLVVVVAAAQGRRLRPS